MVECIVCKIEYKPESLTAATKPGAMSRTCRQCRTDKKQTELQKRVFTSIQNDMMSLVSRIEKLEKTVAYIDIMVDGAVDTKVNSFSLAEMFDRIAEERFEKIATHMATLNSRVLALTEKLQKLEE